MVSVIIPIYNVEKIVSRVIDSILAQSYKDFELILVDDGSTDGSGAICDEYAVSDHRIKVVHQENLGVSSARNAGLDLAVGNWVTFVDSDDLVLDCFLESLVNAVSSNDLIDLAYVGYAIITGGANIKTYKSNSYIGQDQIHELLSKTNLLYRCSPWAKLFRQSIIEAHRLRFDVNLSISEDRLFIYNYLVHVRGVATTSQVGYLYGSFSPSSLKHKRVPSEMLAYRQRAITAAAHNVIKQFALGSGDAYLISRHLTLILFELIRCVYQESGALNKVINRQRDLFDELFDNSLYVENLKNDQRWQQQLNNNKLINYMVNQQFNRLNWKFRFDDINLSCRRFAYRLLKQRWASKPIDAFNYAITLINNKL